MSPGIKPFVFIIFLLLICCSPPARANFSKEATTTFFTNRINDSALPTETRIRYLDSLFSVKGEEDPLNFHIKRGLILTQGCRYDDAYRDYHTALRMLPGDSVRMRAILNFRMAQNAFYGSHYSEAAKHCLDILRIKKPDSLLWTDIEAFSILNAMEGYQNKSDGCIYNREMESCMAKLKKSGANPNIIKKAETRLLISSALADNDPQRAFRVYCKAKEETKDSSTIDGLNNNIGLVHYRMEDYDKARGYFESVLSSRRPGTARLCAVLNYIRSYINEGDGPGAEQAVIKYKHILDQLIGTPFEWEYYASLFDVHALNGRESEGVPYLVKAVQLLDSLHSPRNELLTANTSSAVAEIMLENRYAPQMESSRNKTIGIISLCIALTLCGTGAFFFMWKARRKETEAGDIANRLHKVLSLHREEKEEIGQSLQMKGQEVSSLTIRNEMLRNALDAIVAEISRHESPRSSLSQKVNDIIRNLSGAENACTPKARALESVNQAFFDELHRLHPALTNAEREMCAYSLMGMTPKEIAAMTSRSVKTVNCIRHNMRKKMEIPAGETTESYLRHISASAISTQRPREESDNIASV